MRLPSLEFNTTPTPTPTATPAGTLPTPTPHQPAPVGPPLPPCTGAGRQSLTRMLVRSGDNVDRGFITLGAIQTGVLPTSALVDHSVVADPLPTVLELHGPIVQHVRHNCGDPVQEALIRKPASADQRLIRYSRHPGFRCLSASSRKGEERGIGWWNLRFESGRPQARNLSTRSCRKGDNIVIAGFMLGKTRPNRVAVRGSARSYHAGIVILSTTRSSSFGGRTSMANNDCEDNLAGAALSVRGGRRQPLEAARRHAAASLTPLLAD